MVVLADRTAEATWKIKNLADYDRRLERAARRVDELDRERGEAALVIYEAALMKSGHSPEDVRETVRRFRDTFHDDEEPLTIPRVSGIMNVEGDKWFFGDHQLRVMTGRLLGQFQHRVAQYNYVNEREVLRRWADGYDTRLFIRRRVYDTEPVVGVVEGFDLPLMQYLRVAVGGNTLVPTDNVRRALAALGFSETADDYELLTHAESLALHLDLPAPIVGEMLEDLVRSGLPVFPEPPREPEAEPVPAEEPSEAGSQEPGTRPGPSGGDQEARRTARRDPRKGEEPSRVQDPQAKDAPGVEEEGGEKLPAPPRTESADAPGSAERG